MTYHNSTPDSGNQRHGKKIRNIEAILSAESIQDLYHKSTPLTQIMMKQMQEDMQNHGKEAIFPSMAMLIAACMHSGYKLGLKHGDKGTPIPIAQDIIESLEDYCE